MLNIKMELAFVFVFAFTSYVYCEDIIVTTAVGNIKGFKQSLTFAGQSYNVSTFLGIPYAESTAGQQRFSKPITKAPFEGVYDATEAKPACLQNLQWLAGIEVPASEDCLTLNIFVPSGTTKNDSKAVMIFIYGGGFQFGFQDSYITWSLSALHDVIFVSLNYRLSVYGFLASKENGLKGNYGLWDQHMGIKWVHDNIASFGGNQNAITIFGESAGAVSVIYQAMYEGNRGLFHRVIAQSGVAGVEWAYNKYPDKLFNKLTSTSGCRTVQCLRDLSDEEMQAAFSFGEMYLPVQDDEFIKYDPANFMKNMTKESAEALSVFAEKDVIIGLNSHEGYSESMFFMFVNGENIGQYSDGLSQNEMDKFVRQVFEYNNQSFNNYILKSVIHQYTDWSDQKSTVARRAKYLDFVKDVQYTVSSIQMLDLHVSDEKHTYMYHFEHKPSFSHAPVWVSGADHTEEIPFVLGFPLYYMYIFNFTSDDPASMVPVNELALSRAVMKYWTNFAKTGNPNDDSDGSISQWPLYETVNQTYIRLIADMEQFPTGNHFRNEFVNFWEEIYPDMVNLTMQLNKDRGPCITGSASTVGIGMAVLMTVILLHAVSLHQVGYM